MNDKVVGWYKRHQNLEIKNNWSKEEYDYILDNIINEKINTLEDLLPNLNNKNIYELVGLLQNELKIGNKHVNVILNCAYCGKQIIRNMNEIHKNRVYCNMDCRNKYKRKYKIHRGENNGRYNSKLIKCTNCNKQFLAPKYIQNQTNSYGDNNHFCSQECYWEFRRKYYIGEKSTMHNYKFSKEQINKMRERTVKMFENNKFPTKLTSIHKKLTIY